MVMNPVGRKICKKSPNPKNRICTLQQKHQDIPIFKGNPLKKSPNYHQNSKGFQNPNILQDTVFFYEPYWTFNMLKKQNASGRCTGHRS